MLGDCDDEPTTTAWRYTIQVSAAKTCRAMVARVCFQVKDKGIPIFEIFEACIVLYSQI